MAEKITLDGPNTLRGHANVSEIVAARAAEENETWEQAAEALAASLTISTAEAYGAEHDIRVFIDEGGTLFIRQVMTVVETVRDPNRERALSEVAQQNADIEEGAVLFRDLYFEKIETRWGDIIQPAVSVENITVS